MLVPETLENMSNFKQHKKNTHDTSETEQNDFKQKRLLWIFSLIAVV